MAWSRWDGHNPPPETCGPVSNPDRFAPLHRLAITLAGQLEREYFVQRTEGFGLDAELEGYVAVARATIKLVPRCAAEAPITMAFSRFPGLRVRFGLWCIRSFPSCGCDACNESAEVESEHLKWMTANVIAGRFREAIRAREEGAWWSEWESWAGGARAGQRLQLHRELAERFVTKAGSDYRDWVPWSRREA